MPNWMSYGPRKIWKVGLTAMLIWVAPASLWSQATLLFQGSERAASQPFAGVDDSLIMAADALLASTVQTTTLKAKFGMRNDSGGANLFLQHDPPQRILRDRNQKSAGMRLDLLWPAIEPILRSHGVPPELAVVILVESAGFPAALSPKGARGLWQLMPDTARRYRLRVDDLQDDRLDLAKATDAAARYLHDLYVQFGDWRLALAAYNAGEANVGNAILRAHTQDFDQLVGLRMLPLETRKYVPRVLAAVQSFSGTSDFAAKSRLADPITVFATSNH